VRLSDISLRIRLALAALSGMLTYPATLLGDLLDQFGQPPIFEWWVILHGTLFGAMVMAPFISSHKHVALRVTAMIISSVIAYYAAIELPEIIPLPIDSEVAAFAEAGAIGAVLVALATRLIAPLAAPLDSPLDSPLSAPLSTHARFWGLTLLAGAVGGAIFSQTFSICALQACDSFAELISYSFGWIAWQMLVCAALWLGVRRGPQDAIGEAM